MSEMEEKLNSVLNNPQMMQQIMSMAQSLGAQPQTEQPPKTDPMPEIDLGMLQRLSGLASQGTIDQNQQSLLKALRPYLTRERIEQLEKAMRAAKMARMASGLLSSGAIKL
jgi:hypothetical protein